MKRTYALITALTLLVAGAAQAQTTKWVDQAGGSDANDGNTEATAYASLQFAIDNSLSGTPMVPSVINVKDGTYGVVPTTATCEGLPGAILISNLDYLTIQAVAGHEPVVAPVTTTEINIVSVVIDSSDHLIIDNIDSDQTVAQFDNWHVCGSDDLTVRNSHFEGGEDGIDFGTGFTTALIEGNHFVDINTGSGDEVLDFTDGVYSDVVIQDNLFENNYRQITIRNTASNFTIRRNLMDGTVSEEHVRLIAASDIVVENNVMMNGMQQGVYVDSGCSNITIQHNTFFNNDQESGGNGEIRTKVTTSDIVITDNILNGNGSNPAIETGVGSLVGEDYNLWWNTVQPGFTFGANSINDDPLFLDTTPGSEDLHLDFSSPALGAGIDVGVTDDIEQNARPNPTGTDPDMGAYEMGPKPPVAVSLDVRPANSRNQINTGARQLVPIAILGSATFDPVVDIDIDTVDVRGATPLSTKFDEDDVNGDGFPDLTLYFRARTIGAPTVVECNDPNAMIELTGVLISTGDSFVGVDSVTWLNCG